MIIIKEKARDDLKVIAQYSYENWGVTQTNYYLESFNKVFKIIENSPQAEIKRLEISEDLFSRFHQSHTIFYTYQNDDLIIVRVLHQSRDVHSTFKPQSK